MKHLLTRHLNRSTASIINAGILPSPSHTKKKKSWFGPIIEPFLLQSSAVSLHSPEKIQWREPAERLYCCILQQLLYSSWQLASPLVPAPSEGARGEQSTGFAPTSKLEDILMLMKHQLSLLSEGSAIAAQPVGVPAVLLVSNLRERCHRAAAKPQVAFSNLPAS